MSGYLAIPSWGIVFRPPVRRRTAGAAVPGLEVAGNRVEAFYLPGAGDDDTPVADRTLDAYADRVCDALAKPSRSRRLAGHSMGGMGE